MDEIEIAPGAKVPVKAIERVALGKEEAERVSAWIRQLGESSSGFLQLTKSEVVNFLIREHKTELSPRELQLIRTQHYDPIKHLNWITPRLKEALQNGDVMTVNTLQSEIKSIELSVIASAKKLSGVESDDYPIPSKPKRKRAKKADPADLNNKRSFAELQSELPEG